MQRGVSSYCKAIETAQREASHLRWDNAPQSNVGRRVAKADISICMISCRACVRHFRFWHQGESERRLSTSSVITGDDIEQIKKKRMKNVEWLSDILEQPGRCGTQCWVMFKSRSVFFFPVSLSNVLEICQGKPQAVEFLYINFTNRHTTCAELMAKTSENAFFQDVTVQNKCTGSGKW